MLAEILYVAYIGAQFGSYAFFHDGLLTMIPTSRRESSQATVSFVSGGLAAFVAVSLTYPLDLLRTRFAAQAHPRTYQSIGQASHLIMKTDGILGFYSGWAPTTFALVPSMAVQFALYDWCKRTWFGGQEHANPLVHAVAGGFSGIVSKLAVLPLDVLKKRLQIQGLYQHRSQSTQNQLSNKVPNSATPPSPAPLSGVPHTTTSITTRYSAKDTVKMIYKYEGLPGFFRGAVPSTLKAGVSASLTFTFYEQSKRLLLSMLKNVEGKPH
jgi:solute carrier family 25 thiamine pyrophosphate transporter 19